MIPLPQKTRCAVSLFVVMALLNGCTSEHPTTPANPSSTAHEEHDREHDHGVPDDKPATFADAVHQLPRLHHRVLSELTAGHFDHSEVAIQKLQEVIRWLPELAADTDLGESDWNSVQAISKQLEATIGQWATSRSKPEKQQIELITVLMSDLDPLVEKSRVAAAGTVGTSVSDHR